LGGHDLPGIRLAEFEHTLGLFYSPQQKLNTGHTNTTNQHAKLQHKANIGFLKFSKEPSCANVSDKLVTASLDKKQTWHMHKLGL
jgi:hypothetical protein